MSEDPAKPVLVNKMMAWVLGFFALIFVSLLSANLRMMSTSSAEMSLRISALESRIAASDENRLELNRRITHIEDKIDLLLDRRK